MGGNSTPLMPKTVLLGCQTAPNPGIRIRVSINLVSVHHVLSDNLNQFLPTRVSPIRESSMGVMATGNYVKDGVLKNRRTLTDRLERQSDPRIPRKSRRIYF